MADVKRTVEILFQGDDKVSEVARNIDKSFSQLDLAAQTVAQPLARVADGVLALDAALATMAIGGLVYATSKSIEFEGASIELAKVLGDESDRLGELQQQASDLAFQYGESASNVLRSAASWKQAGFDASDAMLLTKNSLDLVIAGDLEASEASELLVASLKGFKLPAQEAAHLIDIMNEVSNNYATDIRQLAIGMGDLSPVASLMGFTMEETAGMLTPVVEVFRSGSEAARALKTGLLKLVDDTQPVHDALTALGVSQRDANGQLKSGKDILFEVASAFQTVSDADKIFLTQQLVGIDQSARMIEVFNSLAKVTEITAVAQKSAGSAAQEVALRLASAEVQIERVKVGWEELNRIIGDQFRASVGEGAGAFADLERAIYGAINQGAFSDLFDALSGWSTALAAWLRDVTNAVPEAMAQVNFDGLIVSLRKLGGEFGQIFAGVDLRTPEGLASAIQWVVDSLESLATVTRGMVDGFGVLFEALSEGVSRFNDLGEADQAAVGKILSSAKIVAEAGTAIGGALIALSAYGVEMQRVFGLVKAGANALQIAVEALVVVMSQLVAIFTYLLEYNPAGLLIGAFTDFDEKLQSVRETLLGWKVAAKDAIPKDAQEMVDGLGQAFGDLEPKIDEAREAIEKTKGSTREAASSWNELVAKLQETPKEIAFGPTVEPSAVDEVLSIISRQIPDFVPVEVRVDDQGTAARTGEILLTNIPDHKQSEVIVTLDDGSVILTNKALDGALPGEKSVAVKPKVDEDELKKTEKYLIEQLKSQQELLTTTVEWTAKLNIADIEAETKKVEAAFDSINNTVSETGETVRNIFDNWSNLDIHGRWEARRALEQELEIQREMADLQEVLIGEQIKLMELKRQAIERGEGLIKIDSNGLEPALEMVMWQILEKVQLRATEDAASFLLGM